PHTPSGLTRIGVFYDGNYFLHVSNYYNFIHPKRKRLNIGGLHDFIRHQVAQEEGVDVRLCQVVDSHYFRGRLSAQEASQRGNQLYFDRVFDDILMSEGVITHYLPLKNRGGKKEEKGIDVWLALEAFEMAIYKRFDVLVLIAADGDYVPLIRKLNTLGTRVMVLSWDFEYNDELTGKEMVTRTSQELLEEVTYPVAMHEIIDNRVKKNDPLIVNLFVNNDYASPINPTGNGSYANNNDTKVNIFGHAYGQVRQSTTLNMKQGFGFIYYPPSNLFFHRTDVIDGDFSDIKDGDEVFFVLERDEKGQDVAKKVRKVSWERPSKEQEMSQQPIPEE
ncbi:MAG: NYN domain-containing protein, partial [Flammeovirgaceae bacterium]|nr:NYN domain-containing protein [Flammeovirgaceae bacterium]MDW8287598.1 NYN domain-containing protein [Flammeovirgaceae bacterium]